MISYVIGRAESKIHIRFTRLVRKVATMGRNHFLKNESFYEEEIINLICFQFHDLLFLKTIFLEKFMVFEIFAKIGKPILSQFTHFRTNPVQHLYNLDSPCSKL